MYDLRLKAVPSPKSLTALKQAMTADFNRQLQFFYKHFNTIIINQYCPALEHAHIIHEIWIFFGSGLPKEEC